MKITLEEIEKLILEGKERHEIKGDLTDHQYSTCLEKIMMKYNKFDVITLRLEYIKSIEDLFFNAHELYEESTGSEKIFWKNRRDHLASIYITYKALQPVKKIKD
jgi:hypothetical protein